MSNVDYDLVVKLRFGDEYIGPGIIRLLELSDSTGSMNEACSEMGMAYSKAWKILKQAERITGQKLLDRITGGAGGGSSQLTPEGRKLVEDYREFKLRLEKSADEHFAEVFR